MWKLTGQVIVLASQLCRAVALCYECNAKRRQAPTTMKSSAVSFFAFGALLPAAAGWNAALVAAADPPAVAPLRPAFGEGVMAVDIFLALTLGLSALAGDAGFVTRLFPLVLLTACKAVGDCESTVSRRRIELSSPSLTYL